CRLHRVPVERRAALAQRRPRRLVAERALDTRLIEGPRRDTERGCSFVVAGQVGVEHGRVVGRDRALNAGGDETGQRMLGEASAGPSAQVGNRAGTAHRPAPGDLTDEAGIVLGANAMTQAVGAEHVERSAHRGRPDDLPGVRHRAQAFGLRQRERRLVGLWRILGLEPAEADADDAAVAVARGPTNGGDRLVERVATWNVRCQSHFDAVPLAGLLGPTTDALEHLLPVEAATDAFGRREDAFDVDGAVLLRLGSVVDDDLMEVGLALKRVR